MTTSRLKSKLPPIPNIYQNYPGRPRLIEAAKAISSGIVKPLTNNKTVYQPLLKDQAELGSKIVLDHNEVFDLVTPTFFGLNEVLVPGLPMTQQFIMEWNRFNQATLKRRPYGVYAYYPGQKHLVRLMEPFWHRLALVVSNSELYTDPKRRLTWHKIRRIFEKTVVAIAGCSVGNSIAFCLASNLRPTLMKVADLKDTHIANANRVRWSYADIGRNKAVVTAEQLHAIDPYFLISVYPEGIHSGNVVDFVGGNKNINEPKTTIIVEETDDPEMKIFVREIARKHRVPVLMITDAGSIIQRDIRRFDLDSNLSLAVGVSDKQLYSVRDKALADPGNRDKFFDFAFTMVGTNCLQGEFEQIVRRKIEPLFGSIPQLGSTASAAGGYAAESVCRMVLGYPQFERELFNLQSGEAFQLGKKF